MTTKPVLVTGASGFVAQHCIKLLLEQGYRVRGTLRSTSGDKATTVRRICPQAADEKNLELVEADLLADVQDWVKVVEGCEWIFHVASPLRFGVKDPMKELVDPAVKGTTTILKAAAATPMVRKVIITGSALSCQRTQGKNIHIDASIWTNLDREPTVNLTSNAYAASKVLAGSAAWKFYYHLKPSDNVFDLTVILPAFILGPVLDGTIRSSSEVISGMLTKKLPVLFDVPFQITDVRDVARAHLEAALRPEAAAKRILLCSGSLKILEK